MRWVGGRVKEKRYVTVKERMSERGVRGIKRGKK